MVSTRNNKLSARLPSASQKHLRFTSLFKCDRSRVGRGNKLNLIRTLFEALSSRPRPWQRNWRNFALNESAQGTYHASNHFVPRIHLVNFDDMITEIQRFKTIFLSQQSNEGTSGPVEAFTKALPEISGESNMRKALHNRLVHITVSYEW